MVSEVESSDEADQLNAPATSQPSLAGGSNYNKTSASCIDVAIDGNVPAVVPPEKACPSSPAKECKVQQVFSCDQCGLTFRKRDDFDRHRFAHTGVREYRCSEPGCCKEYTNRAHLNRHIRSNHSKKTGSDERDSSEHVPCKHPGCRKIFTTDQSMRRHYDIKHVLGKSWTCSECGERFWRKLQLKQHSFRHTGEYPHNCDICEKGFMNLKSLRNHRTTHALHKCESCSAEFTHWKDLVAHRRLQHPALHQCETCQKQFPSKKNLREHVKVHSKQLSEEQEVFQCPHEGCSKFYDYERNLLVHIRSKHEGTRKFVCPVEGCGRVLSTNQKLAQHRRMHESAAKSVPRMKAPNGKPTAKRKDSGIPKRSSASRLANVRLDPGTEKMLIEQSPDRRPALELECSFSMESASESEAETTGRVGAVLEGQLARIQEQIRRLQEQSGQV